MDIFHLKLVPDFGINICQTQIRIAALACILFTAQCTLVFVTAVNELEFCKTLKFQLSQDRDITMDIDNEVRTNELCTTSTYSSE